jgi:zinc transport system permease protein
VRVYSVLLSVMAAVTVTVAMRTVGLLLVSALMVIPAATAQQVFRGFRVTLLAGMVAGTLAGLGGVVTSFYVAAPPGATIVLLALAGFAMTWPVGAALRRRRRVAAPFEDEDVVAVPSPHATAGPHPHEHGEHCGHPAVVHGDHVDYVHDGHRHAPHGDHYDEH